MDAILTISMTVYNTSGKMLRRAVQGILGQTMKRWRLVIVNDGGNDCWEAIADIDDPRIERIDNKDNLGTYARHAQVLAGCKTPWWSPHDSDDYISSDRYAALLMQAQDTDDLVIGGYTDVCQNKSIKPHYPLDTPFSPSNSSVSWSKHVSTWAGALWSTAWLRSIGGIDPSYRTSYDSALQTLTLTYGAVRKVPHLGYFRTIHDKSLTKNNKTGYSSLFRRDAQRHIRDKITTLPPDATPAMIATTMNTGDYVPLQGKHDTTPIRIIVNTICMDSEPELPAMLASLLPGSPGTVADAGRLVDGLVVVDGGSTDNTVSLACKWAVANTAVPAHIATEPWPDDFGAQRNLCLNKTRDLFCHNGVDTWVLMIDSDDTLAAFDRPYIEEVIRECGVDAIVVTMDNGSSTYNATQLFRLTPDAVWKNPIHEFVHIEGTKAVVPQDKLTIRRGHARRHNTDPMRNVRIGGRFVEQSPCDRRGRFYMARDLMECQAMPYVQRMAQAEGHLRMYLAIKGTFVEQDRMARVLLCRILWETGRVEEARQLMHESLLHDPNNRSAYEALQAMAPSDDKPAWEALSHAVDGKCVLPYHNRLPQG